MGKKIGICLGVILVAMGIVIENTADAREVFNEDITMNTVEKQEAPKKEEPAAYLLDNEALDVDESMQQPVQEIEPRIETIKLVSVGDIMMHSDEISCGYNGKTKSYNYDFMFEEVKPYLEIGDITIGNLEFTMSGPEKGYTGYPMFNAPSEMADAIAAASIDVLSTANNHSLDRRFDGVSHTIDVLDHRNILHTGTYKTKEASEQILYTEVKDTKIAFLSYTYGTNGIPTDKDKPFCVNYIDKDKIKQDLQKARAEGAELICVSMHWGVEYVTKQIKEQEELADFLIQNGADIILGGHPHVLEPMEIREVALEGKKKEVVLIYSQGNFISGQRDRYKDTGAIFNIFMQKNFDTNEITLQKVSYIPTWVDNKNSSGKTQYRVIATKRSIHMYETEQDSDLSAKDYDQLKRSLKDARTILCSQNDKIVEELTFAD